MESIAKVLVEQGLDLTYGVYLSSQNWHDEDRPLLDLCRRSGMRYAYLGLESGFEPTLRRFRKAATVSDNERAVKLLAEVGIGIKYGFIMFHPYSTLEEFIENRVFLVRTRLGCFLGSFFNELYPYEGTPIHMDLKNDGLLTGERDSCLGHDRWRFRDPAMQSVYDVYQGLSNDETIRILRSQALEFGTLSLMYGSENLFSKELRNRHQDYITEVTTERMQMCTLNDGLAGSIAEWAGGRLSQSAMRGSIADYRTCAKESLSRIQSTNLRYRRQLRISGASAR
jgi:radical SAM superfamily enzyme YgiQ (UPF0313 family)